MSNSSLVTVTVPSPNRNRPRIYPITRITPHCVVGQATASSICNVFIPTSREASCNYAIGHDGTIGLCVDEADRSWCSGNYDNDHRAVTIETASDTFHPYAMTDKAYNSLVDLCTDICKRNGKTKLLWLETKIRTLNYTPEPDEMILTVHRWFQATACPGDWLFGRMDKLAEAVTNNLKEDKDNMVYYETREDIPKDYLPTIDKLIANEALKGTGDTLHVSDDMCRIFTVLDRLGKL